ncbi:MAG: transposase [Rudanella sp.]|nr:transposase [Rudanella sp.]
MNARGDGCCLNPDEQLQLQAALEISPTLGSIYHLRTKLKAIFDTDCSREAGFLALTGWEEAASKLESKPLAKSCRAADAVTVKNWKDKVCNFFTDRLTNAGMEGTNNHIRSIIRRAFGYVDFQSLRLRVLTECGNAP